jgi:phosphate starvation-inducible PhoH-like protein
MARASSGGRVTNKASIRKSSLARERGAALKRSAAAQVNGGGEPTVVFFDDLRLVRDLLGDYDANLAVLEDRLGVEAVVNGNAVSLRGPEASCATAKSVLEQLYVRLAQGEMIGVGEVVGAIRHARTFEPGEVLEPGSELPEAQQIRTRKRLITARTPAQSAYLESLQRNDLVFATGPAGTGKTYLAVAFAAVCLESGRCDRLILSRPAVEAGERLGFLPGDMREKVDPYLRPLYDALYDVLPPERVERGIATGAIEIAPLAFMRGRTLSHAIIILDEAQNCTPVQIKMFLTRLGEESKMIVTGDPTQVDLPPGKDSGLLEAIGLLQGIDEIDHIAFTRADVVRRELVGKIVDAYESAPLRGERNG